MIKISANIFVNEFIGINEWSYIKRRFNRTNEPNIIDENCFELQNTTCTHKMNDVAISCPFFDVHIPKYHIKSDIVAKHDSSNVYNFACMFSIQFPNRIQKCAASNWLISVFFFSFVARLFSSFTETCLIYVNDLLRFMAIVTGIFQHSKRVW